MKEIVFGLIAGIITSLGMGGGAILIVLLNIFSNFDQHLIQGINLIFFIPTAIFSIITNWKNRILDIMIIKTVGISGIIGAIIGSSVSQKLDSQNLKKYFGYFLLIIAILEIYEFFKKYIKVKKEHNKNNKEKFERRKMK